MDEGRQGHRLESDLRRRRTRPRYRRRALLAAKPGTKGLGRESRRLGEGLILQAAALHRRRGCRPAARGLARRGQHQASVEGDAYRAGCTTYRGETEVAPAAD